MEDTIIIHRKPEGNSSNDVNPTPATVSMPPIKKKRKVITIEGETEPVPESVPETNINVGILIALLSIIGSFGYYILFAYGLIH